MVNAQGDALPVPKRRNGEREKLASALGQKVYKLKVWRHINNQLVLTQEEIPEEGG